MPPIDLFSEDIVSFRDAAKKLPCKRQGKRPHVATLHRWCNAGFNNVRLEYAMLGGTRVTSLQALQRFSDSLTAAAEGNRSASNVAARPSKISKRREKEIGAAEQRLARAGV
jgi:hypothetical protein